MVRRWQLALWVLGGLVLSVFVLWDRASSSAQLAEGTRIETIDGGDLSSLDAPDRLAFDDLDETAQLDGGGNRLRPTTTTTTTTTTSTTDIEQTSSTDNNGDSDSSSSTDTTSPGSDSGRGEPGDRPTTTNGDPGGSTTSDGQAGSGTTHGQGPINYKETYYQDFASGELLAGEWIVYHSVGHEGWGLRRRSAIAVQPDAEAAGEHVLEITAAMGSGNDAGSVVSGGLKLYDRSISTGRVSFRARVDRDPEQVTAGVVHLWPVDDVWPDGGEINIMNTRSNRDTRSPVRSDLHWSVGGGPGSAGIELATSAGAVIGSDWHIYTLTWTADVVTVAVDGGVAQVLSDNRELFPPGALDVAIQLDASDSPDRPALEPVLSGQVRMQIDWLRIEESVDLGR